MTETAFQLFFQQRIFPQLVYFFFYSYLVMLWNFPEIFVKRLLN